MSENNTVIDNKTNIQQPITDSGITQQTSNSKNSNPQVQQNQPKPKIPKIRIILILFIIIALFVFVLFRDKIINTQTSPGVVNTPTPVSRPAPHFIATSSAYLELKQEISSLSAELGAYRSQDVTINPPLLDLSLDFANN